GLTNTDLRLVLLVGVGTSSPEDLRRAGAALARRVKGRRSVATSLAAAADDAGLAAFVEGVVLGSFVFHWRSDGPPERPVERVVLAGQPVSASRRATVEKALAIAGASWLARTLALVPSNVKNPAWLAEQATEVATGAGLAVEVWDEKALRQQG